MTFETFYMKKVKDFKRFDTVCALVGPLTYRLGAEVCGRKIKLRIFSVEQKATFVWLRYFQMGYNLPRWNCGFQIFRRTKSTS